MNKNTAHDVLVSLVQCLVLLYDVFSDNSTEESSLWEHLKYFNDAFTKLHSESLSLFGAIVRSIQGNSQKIKTLEHHEMEQQEDENVTMDDGAEINYQDNGIYPSTHSLPIDEGKIILSFWSQ